MSKVGLRKTILIAQFALSLVFILSVTLLYKQLELFRFKDHGFSMTNNLVIKLNNTSAEALKTELLKYGNIKNVSAVSHVPASGTTYGNGFKKDAAEKEWSSINFFVVDEDYLKNMEVELVAGRHFSSEAGAANKHSIVINEEAVKSLHYASPRDAVGEELIYQPDSSRRTIIGVVRNYNHQFLLSEISPMALLYDPAEVNLLQVKYSGSYDDAVASSEKAWAAINPGLKIDYNDFESEIKQFYDIIFGDLVHVLGVIALLAIIISCLGLLGMATYATETRRKEVSIRKILGSTNSALVLFLSRDFLLLIGVAIMIGVPLAWFINNLWLQLIAYRTTFSAEVIFFGIGVLLVLAILTITSQTLRAAFENPVDHLKSE